MLTRCRRPLAGSARAVVRRQISPRLPPVAVSGCLPLIGLWRAAPLLQTGSYWRLPSLGDRLIVRTYMYRLHSIIHVPKALTHITNYGNRRRSANRGRTITKQGGAVALAGSSLVHQPSGARVVTTLVVAETRKLPRVERNVIDLLYAASSLEGAASIDSHRGVLHTTHLRPGLRRKFTGREGVLVEPSTPSSKPSSGCRRLLNEMRRSPTERAIYPIDLSHFARRAAQAAAAVTTALAYPAVSPGHTTISSCCKRPAAILAAQQALRVLRRPSLERHRSMRASANE